MIDPCYGLPAGLPERGTLAQGFVQLEWTASTNAKIGTSGDAQHLSIATKHRMRVFHACCTQLEWHGSKAQ